MCTLSRVNFYLEFLLTISKLLRIYISFWGRDHNHTALILHDCVYNVILLNVLFENGEVTCSNVSVNFKRYEYINTYYRSKVRMEINIWGLVIGIKYLRLDWKKNVSKYKQTVCGLPKQRALDFNERWIDDKRSFMRFFSNVYIGWLLALILDIVFDVFYQLPPHTDNIL